MYQLTLERYLFGAEILVAQKKLPQSSCGLVGSTKDVTEDGRLHWADLCEISPVI